MRHMIDSQEGRRIDHPKTQIKLVNTRNHEKPAREQANTVEEQVENKENKWRTRRPSERTWRPSWRTCGTRVHQERR